ncbi:POT family domain-containing protein [Ditylenchus destructor]|uniref:POT family domain-containing protein n=1 Tax=Ditylenchus destructor TaxID=166010 RepID=A0AAD4QXJ3_9BILA|nr:POT family domain-containing protein [Ditylenchus destructor]
MADSDMPRTHTKSNAVEEYKSAESWRDMARLWPKCSIPLVLNIFCFRFTALGTVLSLYVLNVLHFTQSQTNTFFYVYTGLLGLSTFTVAFIGDGYLGRYRTIIYSTLLIVLGKLVIASASAMGPFGVHPWLDVLGAFSIIIGSGGVQACLVTFGGDQFPKEEKRMLSIYFSIYYWMMSIGVAMSAIFLPIMRETKQFLSTPFDILVPGHDTCYPLSFGVSAGIMVFATG